MYCTVLYLYPRFGCGPSLADPVVTKYRCITFSVGKIKGLTDLLFPCPLVPLVWFLFSTGPSSSLILRPYLPTLVPNFFHSRFWFCQLYQLRLLSLVCLLRQLELARLLTLLCSRSLSRQHPLSPRSPRPFHPSSTTLDDLPTSCVSQSTSFLLLCS